jgi:ribosome-associated heat shock protein Hsp15
MGKQHSEDRDGVRLDKWLWAARFFKTRSLAQDAIDGGKVYIDGVRAKSSRLVAVGQELQITAPRGAFTILIEQVTDRRGSGTVAATMFRETDESRVRREELVSMHKLSAMAAPQERPNTQDRRALRRLKEGE